MATGVLPVEVARAVADDAFYASYRWCLNPMLSVRDLLHQLCAEVESYRANGATGWQGEERRINLYLFACAIGCALDDYLGGQQGSVASRARRFLAGRPAVKVTRSGAARAAAWRQQWTDCIDAACELLLGGDGARFFERVRPSLISASSALSEAAQQQRMRIPEAFRCQDLTHQDVCAMVRLCLPWLTEKDRATVIVGPRTAGAYFAPLAGARLRSLGYSRVTWVTVRPKEGLSRAESGAISTAAGAGAQILIIDDHPNSGHTLRLLLSTLGGLGADPQRIVVALPGHPSIPDFALTEETARGARVCLLPPEERYKARLLAAEGSHESPVTAALNERFAAHYGDGFQVRLKRVIEDPDGRRLMAKSVGWGWLGYHAWLAGSALAGFVPRMVRLREGILFSEYIESEPAAESGQNRSPQLLGSYIARRVSALGLSEDPAFAAPGYRWCGWDDLVAQFSRIYGPRLGHLKKRAIRRRLQSYAAPNPTLIDGRMKPADWVRTDGEALKTDFEHHNFGGGERDIVDAAWDLASAIYEFQLAPDAEEELLRSYVAQSGDAGIEDRLPLYKILYAMSALRAAKYWLARKPSDERREEWNRQFIGTRSFVAFHIARHCGRDLGDAPTAWERRLFFLDLDGVLDWGLLGFPHTSRCGVHALRMLRRNRFAVVLNTARSLEHVREYCRAYRLPGGVAELGSVFYDAVRDWEVPLIDAEPAAQIEELREEIRRLPGVFVDPENRYSIRAYRFEDGYMRPLRDAEIEQAIERMGCGRLTFIQSQADTYIVQKGAGKGVALASVQAYLGCSGEPVAAMGDSRQDVEMLRAAEIAFAPANASREVRELVARGECRKTSRPLQAGLLEAAMELCLAAGHSLDDCGAGDDAASLIDELLQVPDRRPVERIFSALHWRGI
jgi:hydroxymethylpyrimidine pyrophosphatase-like HAD family hydrolase/adenine/guanine phosphoribosyltransferase-like PRPP-binding protein